MEEFRNGRSAAWYWRQTLVVILTGLGQNARLFWRCLIANIIGWMAETAVTVALWRSHRPPQLHGIAGAITAIAVAVIVFLLLFFPQVLTPKETANDGLSATETAQEWNRTEDEEDERFNRWLRRCLLAMYASVTFVAFLSGYCAIALLGAVPLWLLVVLQTEWFFITIRGVLLDRDPSPAKIFTTLN